ncbi:hypothetical protein FEM48_Zijuj03G0111400 [Ziziphus jujuba var. spinosa]|uniref:SNF2 domain-containing protein CLASSY 1-like n=1 Tax=Ziziphus jujuba var. spinosa TaxID=714518 RepID=A0A978VPY7_ZIZJJ|nr:hypothetical protein FEM48_Zijuj03G0111400 [Ziziphus jujuba var. spinosa]
MFALLIFHLTAFEALYCGSWKSVELVSIRNGTMGVKFVDNQYVIQEKGPLSDIRIKSRQATLSDCTCFLRPSVDICVLLDPQQEESSDKAWVDARISSIERKPHESECSCQFFVNLYIKQGPLGSEKGTLSKEIVVVGINQISILQKLDRNYCEDQYYRWDFSEDCSLLQKTKLLLGKFLCDISWLLVASSIKHIAFNVRSMQNKIMYQILEGVDDSCSSLRAVNFRVENNIPVATVVQFVPADSILAYPACDELEAGSSSFSDIGLRRSKRRNLQPDRFLGCDNASEIDIGNFRSRPYKIDLSQDDEMSLPLSCLFRVRARRSEVHAKDEKRVVIYKEVSSENLLEFKSNTESVNVKSGVTKRKKRRAQLAITPISDKSEAINLEYSHLHAKSTPIHAKKNSEISLQYYYNNKSRVRRKHTSDFEDIELDSIWEGKTPKRRGRKKKYHSSNFKSPTEERTYQKRTLSAGAYKEMINSFLKNMDCTSNQEQNITDQWKESKASGTEAAPTEEEEEMSETEMLWKEMELALASTYLTDDDEVSNVGVSRGTVPMSFAGCQHEYKIDEEIGILCRICGFVLTEIRDVSPPFMQNAVWNAEDKRLNEEDLEHKANEDEGMNIKRKQDSVDEPLSGENENVWALIPELRKQLHLHQKKGFEFLWRNVAGSLIPSSIDPKSKKTGGCVISHSPGAGKTFLIIAFLVSYLKLYPGKRPLVLAPKTTLYTWYKEFIKWKIPVPVYLIHGRRTYRVFKQKSVSIPGYPKPSDDVMHVLDCLEKIQKWHSDPSVLVMGYSSFLTLMREDSKFVHRKFMARVLRESPGILILDEGHNPRSTKSRLRKVLMKVETELRVLLSGTLFQNNFCEYFNTLCLARPKFVNEVLKALDPKYKKKKVAKKARNLLEARARKFFLDKIAKKIDSVEGEERMQGLNMLKNITNGFIDVYEGGGSDTLPGLQIYTLLMNSTDKQHEILVKLHEIMSTYHGYPLELELLITLGSIHPWLVKTAVCANKFFSNKELMEFEKYKFDLKKGSKVKFVLNLVYRVVRKEKILIFCHNIAPVKLFVELFESVFGWKRGREVLVLTGDLELFDRGRVMDRFEEPGGPSRVLLASITACAEGISLTAASRVILLDSEWNPSKTKQAIARAFRPGQQKVVYVYQLLATGTLEEDKYRRTTWKEWVSSMIFSEAFVEDPSSWQANKIEDDILREMVAEDRTKSFHMIMKNEKASTVIREMKDDNENEKASTVIRLMKD